MIVPLYKDKGERTESKNYRDISLLNVVGNIYAGIFVDIVHKVTEDLIDDEQRVFRVGRGCVDQIFTLKQIGEKAQEKNCVCVLWIRRTHMRGTIGKYYENV